MSFNLNSCSFDDELHKIRLAKMFHQWFGYVALYSSSLMVRNADHKLFCVFLPFGHNVILGIHIYKISTWLNNILIYPRVYYINVDNTINNRQERGIKIANSNQVRRIDEHHYKVKSQSRNLEHDVISTESGLSCSCEDHLFRKVCCIHIHAVEFSLKLRKEVKEKNKVVIEQIDCSKCIQCQSLNIVKHGIRRNKSGDIQRFSCKDCGKWFVFNLGFEGMRVNPKAITSAMQLYFTGESLRNVQQFLKLQGVNVSHQTVYNWIKKYTGLMKGYLDKITPQVGDTWRADEVFIKVSGNLKYLFAMMDDETRFWIAQEVAESKNNHDARHLFRMANEVAGKKPTKLITDGLPAYRNAYLKEYFTRKAPRIEHESHITLKGDRNNNKMERLNGEFRDREKVVRGLKKNDSPLIDGYQLFHNYIRPHMALDGKTPSEACGITIQGDDKWKTLIQRASL
jgi:transposase-like protein